MDHRTLDLQSFLSLDRMLQRCWFIIEDTHLNQIETDNVERVYYLLHNLEAFDYKHVSPNEQVLSQRNDMLSESYYGQSCLSAVSYYALLNKVFGTCDNPVIVQYEHHMLMHTCKWLRRHLKAGREQETVDSVHVSVYFYN